MRREREKIALQYLRAHRQHDISLRVRFRETGWDDHIAPKGCRNFNYDATKDDTCRYTKTKNFQKHQTKQKAARHQDFYETLVTKHLSPIENYGLKSTVSLPKLPAAARNNLASAELTTVDGSFEVQEIVRVKSKALKSIKKREALLLQLNAVVLCWPAQLHRPDVDPLGAVSRVFQPGLSAFQQAEATLSTLASHLRIEGIRTIEKVAAWMLFVSPGSAEPPEFIWNGQNYVMKMLTDMDFVFDTLGDLASSYQYGRANPLLLRLGSAGVVVAETSRERAAMSLILDVARRGGRADSTDSHTRSMPALNVVGRLHAQQVHTQNLAGCSDQRQNVHSKNKKRVHFAPKSPTEEEKEEVETYTDKTINKREKHQQCQVQARMFLISVAQVALQKLHDQQRLQKVEKERYLTILSTSEREKLAPLLEWISDPNEKNDSAEVRNKDILDGLTSSIQQISGVRRREWMKALESNALCFQKLLELAHSCVNSLLRPVVREAEWRLNGGGAMDDETKTERQGAQRDLFISSESNDEEIRANDGVACCAELGVQEVCTVVENAAADANREISKDSLVQGCLQAWCRVISDLADVGADSSCECQYSKDQSTQLKSRCNESRFYNDSVNRLLKVLSAPLLDGQITSASKLAHLSSLESKLGLPPLADHASLLMPPCKRLLLHLWLTSQRTQSVSVIMARHVAFEASFELLLAGGYLSPVPDVVAGVYLDDSSSTSNGSDTMATNSYISYDGTEKEDANVLKLSQPAGVKSRQAPCILSPYFKSSYGAKSAAGETVEEGEGHGPRKEFFSLLAKQMHTSGPIGAYDNKNDRTMEGSEQSSGSSSVVAKLEVVSIPLFEWRQGCEALWFTPGLTRDYLSSSKFLYAGFLLASAVANQCYLDLQLPLLFFKKLLDDSYQPTLDDLYTFDPTLHLAITNVSAMGDDEFADLMKVQGYDEKEDSINSKDKLNSREIFIQHSMKEALVDSVQWQFESLKAGFFHTVPREWLEHLRLTPAELREVVCGPQDTAEKDFFLRDIFRVEMDGELVHCKELHDVLWEVLDGFPVTLKRKFLAFVTGIDRLPASGTEFLKIEMPFIAVGFEEHQQLIRMLPQSHTCDNILELPNYWEGIVYMHLHRSNKHDLDECSAAELQMLRQQLYDIVHHKLKMAAENSAGYGLDSLAIEIQISGSGEAGDDGDDTGDVGGGNGYSKKEQDEGEHYSDFDTSSE